MFTSARSSCGALDRGCLSYLWKSCHNTAVSQDLKSWLPGATSLSSGVEEYGKLKTEKTLKCTGASAGKQTVTDAETGSPAFENCDSAHLTFVFLSPDVWSLRRFLHDCFSVHFSFIKPENMHTYVWKTINCLNNRVVSFAAGLQSPGGCFISSYLGLGLTRDV